MNLRTFRSAMSVFLLVSLSSGLIASEWHVAPPPVGDDSNPGTKALPFATVQRGIEAASDGDTVIVAQGTYVENIRFNGKNITLTSTDPLDRRVVKYTIIDGNKAGSVVRFSGTETEGCVLSGFTIRNGDALDGGGILGGTYPDYTHATIQNNTIAGNSARYYGGGLFLCDGTIQSNTITGNSAEYGGGPYFCAGTIQSNTITGNTAKSGGGGLYACPGTIQNNTIAGNSAQWGGGLHECNGTIQNNTITGNSATSSGGGLAYCDATIHNNTITGNSAQWGGGLGSCNGTIENNTITGNSAAYYGSGPFYYGGGLYDCNGAIQNNTITGNSATTSGGGLFYCNGTIRNSIIWANTAPRGPQVYDSSIPTYSCIQDWTEGGEGNITTEPLFFDPLNMNFRLRPLSPCIDVGFADPTLPPSDNAGMHRVMYGGKGLTVDMGAWEYYVNTLSRELGGNAVLTWSSLAGKTYWVLTSSDMLTWETAAETVPSLGDTTTTWTDTTSPFLSPSVRTRYYRTLERRKIPVKPAGAG